MSYKTWQEGRFTTDGRSWWDPKEVDDRGHQVVWGYSNTEGSYYKKTHRGKRGRPANSKLKEALIAKEEALQREQELSEVLRNLRVELKETREGAQELEEAISSVHEKLDDERAKASKAQALAEEEAESRVELELQLKELQLELDQAKEQLAKNVPLNLQTELPSGASSSSGNKVSNKITPSTSVKTEVKEEQKGEPSTIRIAFDFHNTLETWRSRDQRFPIPGSVTNAVQAVIEEGIEVEVVSFAIERASDVHRTLSNWPVWEFLSNVHTTDQRFGAPYKREGILTQGGKDFQLASRGINVIFDDSPLVCSACEAQGIVVYRVDPPSEPGAHGTKHSYRTVEDAIAAFLAHLKSNPAAFYKREPFFDADKVPWLSTKRHRDKIRCYKCGQPGHKAAQCRR